MKQGFSVACEAPRRESPPPPSVPKTEDLSSEATRPLKKEKLSSFSRLESGANL
jgi:hypothetical protein